MALSKCSFNSPELIKSEMDSYKEQWISSSKGHTQTHFFKSNVPLEPVDFTETFKAKSLDKIFAKAVTEMRGPYNCNMVYRQTHVMPDVVLYSDNKYVALHPLGEPGRDLGDHDSRASHIMVVAWSDIVPLTLNEMLPSSDIEIMDLAYRNAFLNKAYEALAANTSIGACGEKVIQRAVAMGMPVTMGIREFMGKQISSFTKEFRESGRPGYILKDATGNDVSADPVAVQGLIDKVFTNPALQVTKCVQGPKKCSQLITHIHGFLLTDKIPELIRQNYVCTEAILKAKRL